MATSDTHYPTAGSIEADDDDGEATKYLAECACCGALITTDYVTGDPTEAEWTVSNPEAEARRRREIERDSWQEQRYEARAGK